MLNDSLLLYALTTIVGIIGILVKVIHGNFKSEIRANSLALESKASSENLRESKLASTEALSEVKSHFKQQLDKQHEDYRDRLNELTMKQDREIDWLKDEMNKFSAALNEMRKESNENQSAMMRQLQEMTMMMTTRTTYQPPRN